MGTIKEVEDSNFESEVLQSDYALVDFWAEWCRPCKALMPTIEKIASDFPNISVVKINIDENPNTPAKYNVRSIPTLILYKNGQVQEQLVGNIPYEKIKECIEKTL